MAHQHIMMVWKTLNCRRFKSLSKKKYFYRMFWRMVTT